MSQLIALVATAVLVDGKRKIIQPGEPLPDLTGHDQKELLDSGSALDPEKEASTEQARKQEEAFAQREFQEARKRFQDERASIAATSTADGQTAADASQTASNVVNDGKSGELMPDVSEQDRAAGRVELSQLQQPAAGAAEAPAPAPAATDAAQAVKVVKAAKDDGKKSTQAKE